MNLHNWSPLDLLGIGTCLSLLLFSLACSTWKAFRSPTKIWLWRLYAAVIWTGLVITLYSDRFTNPAMPEMPPEFVAGVWLMMAGIVATIIHSLLILARHLRQRRSLQIG